ncbi:heme ABC transporter permease/ATP-binding protein CydD [Dongshaea marina]|uniref:heme ABC transporter permease/ATP-binding protein CydD n=1 Tax=Dongshaea marina TaxID=2047966 RepID=UPI000D3E55D0|nr:cysteine/glutathione ABC transporter permease/ATP-binding protein CydD [Dongshaea marina]
MNKTREKLIQRWLRQQTGRSKRWLRVAVGLGIANGLLLVGQAALLAHIISAIIIHQQAKAELLTPFIALIILFVARALCNWGKEICGFRAASEIRSSIRDQLLVHLQKLGPAFIQGKPAGSWSSMLLEQIEEMHEFFAKYIPQTKIAMYLPLIILVAVFPINWASGLLLLITAPLIPIFMILIGMGAADANRKNFQALSRLSAHFLDRLKGFRTLKLFNRGQAERREIEEASEHFRHRTMAVLRLAFLNSAVLEFFASVSIALVAVYFGFNYLGFYHYGSYGATVSLLTGLFVLFLAPEYFLPLRELGSQYHAKAQAIGAAETIYDFLHLESKQPPCGKNALKESNTIEITASDLEVLSAEGVTLAGPVSFEVKAGQQVAVVGRSGAGKSSLINCLLGFTPYRGSLTINGQELKTLDPESLRLQLGWLGQNPQLFSGSVADNLRLGNPELTQEQLWQALEETQAREFVEQKPRQLDFPVGEGGHGLSVGQAQRLALARMLLKPSCLLLLDEPTASLDRTNEQQITQALQRHSKGRTIIMVTHRIEQLQQQDKILVLSQGKLVESGSFEELSEQKGVFHDMLQQRDGRSLDE